MEYDVCLGSSSGTPVSPSYYLSSDELQMCDPFPDPSSFRTFQEFESAVSEWKRSVTESIQRVIPPIHSFLRSPIPIRSSVLRAKNHNYLISRALDGRKITPGETLPEEERRIAKPLSNFLTDAPPPLVLFPPLPEMFNTEEEFVAASLRWMQMESARVLPSHPSEFKETVNVHVSDGKTFQLKRDKLGGNEPNPKPGEGFEDGKLPMLLFALRVTPPPATRQRTRSIEDVLDRDAPPHLRAPLIKFVKEQEQFGMHSVDKNDVYHWQKLCLIGKAMTQPSPRVMDQKQELFYASQITSIESWACKYHIYSQLRDALAPVEIRTIESIFLEDMDKLLSITDVISTFSPKLRISIGLMRDVWKQRVFVKDPTLVEMARAFLGHRLCSVFCEVLDANRRDNAYFNGLQHKIKLFFGKVASGSIAKLIVGGISDESALLISFLIYSFLMSQSADAFIRSFGPEQSFMAVVERLSRIPQPGFNYLSSMFIHNQTFMLLLFPYLIEYLRSVRLSDISDGMFNLSCYFIAINPKLLPKGMKYEWYFDIFSTNLAICNTERIALFLYHVTSLGCRLCQTIWSRKVAQTTSESMVVGFRGYLQAPRFLSPLLLKALRLMLVLKPVKSFLEKQPVQLSSVTALLRFNDIPIRVAAWKVFRTWFLVSYKRMAKILRIASFRKDILAGLCKPTESIMPVIMKLIILYAEKHISIDTRGDYRKDGIDNAFIFIYSGIPIEMVELASLFTDGSLRISRYLRLCREIPSLTENKKILFILNRFRRVLSLRNALRQLLNIRHDEI